MALSGDIYIIFSSNFIGLLLVLTMAMNGLVRPSGRKEEDIYVIMLYFFAGFSCITDPVTAIVNGKPGVMNFGLNLACNSLLYISGVGGLWSWSILMERHLFGRISEKRFTLLTLPSALCLVLIDVNLFMPLVFTVTNSNVYSRLPGFIVFSIVEGGYLAYSVLMYIVARRRGGMFKYFPVWNFVFPISMGIIFQALFYGISIIPASCAVAACGISTSILNEKVYHDELTGLYNRSYMKDIFNKLIRRRSKPITAVMIDVNGFKTINDTYGHLTGDDALIQVAKILNEAVREYGTAVRYAGDEFVLLINSNTTGTEKKIMDKAEQLLYKFNTTAGREYHLAVSYGSGVFDPTSNDPDKFFDEIDKKMYEDKRSHYNPG